MTKLAQVFFTGTVIFLMTVPVLFCQTISGLNIISNKTSINIPHTMPLTYRGSMEGMKIAQTKMLLGVNDTIIPQRDTNIKYDTLGKTNKPKANTFKMKKSPWLAVGLSALVPGAGQLYNQSYWKVPIILGLCGYFGWQVFDNNKQFLDYRDRYAETQTQENGFTGDLNLKSLREFYRTQRDDFIWYFAIAYTINLIDAYIDAHLFDFDVREEKIEHFGKTDIKHSFHIKINI